MASIVKRRNKAGVSYLIRAFIAWGPNKKQITKSTTWRPPSGMKESTADKQAKKEAVLFEEKVKNGTVNKDGKIKFADYAARWMETTAFAPKTILLNHYILGRVNKAIGHISIEKLRVDHIKQFIKNLREDGMNERTNRKLADTTVHRHYALIRSILSTAKKNQIITHNVTDFMDAPRIKKKDARHLDDEQAKAFLAQVIAEPDIRVKAAFTVLLFTGVRNGELCGLEWKDIDFKMKIIHIRRASQYVSSHGIIDVPTKTENSMRSITVTPFVMQVLMEYRQWWDKHRNICGNMWKGEKERLFIKRDGAPIAPSTINYWLTRFIKKYDMPYISPHSLRHTFVTLQIAAGVDIRTVQARSGHARVTTLLGVYTHVVQSAQDKAANAMENMLFTPELHKSCTDVSTVDSFVPKSLNK